MRLDTVYATWRFKVSGESKRDIFYWYWLTDDALYKTVPASMYPKSSCLVFVSKYSMNWFEIASNHFNKPKFEMCITLEWNLSRDTTAKWGTHNRCPWQLYHTNWDCIGLYFSVNICCTKLPWSHFIWIPQGFCQRLEMQSLIVSVLGWDKEYRSNIALRLREFPRTKPIFVILSRVES